VCPLWKLEARPLEETLWLHTLEASIPSSQYKVTKTPGVKTKAEGHGYGANLFGSLDDTTGNDVTLHDAPKDVHEDGLHFGVGRQNLERLNDLHHQSGQFRTSLLHHK
jgi:hypothetical protein